MGMNAIGVGFKAMLFSNHIDSITACGVIIDAFWYKRKVITVAVRTLSVLLFRLLKKQWLV